MQEILSKKIIGERIKALRIEKAYAQADVARFLNLSRSNYSQIELGNQYPTFQTLNALARHYNKSYEWLLHGEGAPAQPQTGISCQAVLKELECSLQLFSATVEKLEIELKELKRKISIS